MDAIHRFLEVARTELENAFENIDEVSMQRAAELIWDSQKHGGRLHVTGIGKPGHVANYIASLYSSTGTPTYFLHGTEAVHGSCGQLVAGDVVICISNSGETSEMKTTAMAVRNNGCKVISVTGNPQSWLSTFADADLHAGITNEGGPMNRAPRTSILVETLVLQALSVVLQDKRSLSPDEYVMRHPGGALGQLRDSEK
ncbi:MAG: SIS domain-containing protein [Clostridiales bacterium]|nr:SIS domain-containing protein [Clostridiales bacterium]